MENNDWVKPFINNLFKCKNNKDYENIYKEKFNYINMPFYKYCSVIEYEKRNLENIDYSIENFMNDELFFQNPKNFNDPFDCFLGFSQIQVLKNLVVYELKKQKKYTKKIEQEFIKLFSYKEFNAEEYLDELIKNDSLAELIISSLPEIIAEFGDDGKLLKETIEDIILNLNDKILLHRFVENKLTIKDKHYIVDIIYNNDIFKNLIKSKINNTNSELFLNLAQFNLKLMIESSPDFMNNDKIEKTDILSLIKSLMQQQFGEEIDNEFESFNKLCEEAFKKCREIISSQFNITCLSERMDSQLMWSHYANKHYGFCLEYDFTNTLTKKYPDLYNAQLMLFPVFYSDKRPLFTEELFKTHVIFQYLKTKALPAKITKNIILGLLFKSEDWAYEKEWRIINIINNKPISNIKLPPARKVFLGAKMEEDARKKVIDIAKSKNIPVYQMFLTMDKYKFDYYQVI